MTKLSREAIARIEAGQTDIGKRLAAAMMVCFLMLVFLVPVGQYLIDYRTGVAGRFSIIENTSQGSETLYESVDLRNNTILENLKQLETELEEGSFLRKLFLPPLQYVLLKFLGQGNEKVVQGLDGWLYYSQGVEYLTGQPFLDSQQLEMRTEAKAIWENPVQPNPLAAIVSFKEQLAKRNIELVLVPVPVKASVHPENLSARGGYTTLANRSWDQFVRALKDENIHLFDTRKILADYRRDHGDAFLATDTHWQPQAMEAVAKELGAYIVEHSLVQSGDAGLRLQEQGVVGEGDISNMLTLPATTDFFPGPNVVVRQVVTEENEFWQPDPNGDMLLLGDSFTNIYSVAGLGWGVGAGFGEHLSYALQRPLDLLARNDSGAYVTREMLATELTRGRDRLAGKKLVIWEFAERELAFGDWKLIDLKVGEPKENGFLVVPSGEKRMVTGVVVAISRSPKPGAVPYRENILTMHLVDLTGEGIADNSDQALVYGWGMRDNRLTELAALRIGDTATFTLQAWDDVEQDYGSYRRSPLDDEMMELELPNWGTITSVCP